jgi:hypothetical protein
VSWLRSIAFLLLVTLWVIAACFAGIMFAAMLTALFK